MKRLTTKSDIRDEIEQQMADYLSQGGSVDAVERGVSGRENPAEAITTIVFDKSPNPRTPIPEVLETLQQRRNSSGTAAPKKNRKPKKRLVYDDFGEPLRWEWEDGNT